MGQVSVTLNGRTYRLECGDGEEAHLIALSEHLGSHVDTMKRKFGQIGDDRLILMAALMVTDELWDMRHQVSNLKQALDDALRRGNNGEASQSAENGLASVLGDAAERLEQLSAQLVSQNRTTK